jgi:BASS family bile acid:Na+ symporter
MSLVFTAFDVSLALSVFAFGLRAQGLADVRFMLARPRLTLLSLLAMYVVTPVLALAVVAYVEMPPAAAVALVALSLSMIPPLLPGKVTGGGGLGTYAIGLVIVVAALAPVGIPLLVDFLGRLTGRPFDLDPVDVVLLVLKLVFAPLLLGLAAGALWPAGRARVERVVRPVANALVLGALVALLVAVLPSTLRFVVGSGGAAAVLGAVLVNAGALGVGHLMGGPVRAHSIALALSCASRHPALALTIAATIEPEANIAVAVVLVQLVNGLMCSAYVKRVGAPHPAEQGIADEAPPESAAAGR